MVYIAKGIYAGIMLYYNVRVTNTNKPEAEMWKKHRHAKCVDDALRRAEVLCKQHHSRLTPIRKKVLELVWSNHKPVKAYDVLAQLGADGFVEKPPTVYRALDFLLENNLVHRIASLNAYVGCNVDHQDYDSKFLICDQCNEVEELVEPKLNQALAEVSQKQKFLPFMVNVEIHGTCAQCAQQ